MEYIRGETLASLYKSDYISTTQSIYPTYLEVLDWLNDKKKIQISVVWETDHYKVVIHNDSQFACIGDLTFEKFENQRKAFKAAIDWVAKHLLEENE